MDPLTAAMLLATELVKLTALIVADQPPEVRAELWKLHLERERAFMAFVAGLRS